MPRRRGDRARSHELADRRDHARTASLVSPAPGVPGKIPFWHGDGLGRPDRARAGAGRVRARARGRPGRRRARARRGRDGGCSSTTTSTNWRRRTSSPTWPTNASGRRLPTDRRIVVERFRDELGDWRVVDPDAVRRPSPRALGSGHRGAARGAARARTRRRSGRTTASRSGCPKASRARRDARRATRFAAAARARRSGAGCRDLLFPSAEEVEDLVVGRLGSLGDVRGPVPRERGPGAAAAAAPSRLADPALAAAAALGRPARRGQPLRLVPDHRRDVSRVPGRPVRPARAARGPRRSGAPRDRGPGRGDGRGVAVRRLAAVRLPGRLHVRGRCSAGGAAGRGAGAGPRAAARAARPGGVARPDRPGGPGRPGAGPAGAGPGAGGAQRDALHDLLRRLGDLSAEEVAAADRGAAPRQASGWPRWRDLGARSRSGSPARSAGSRSRTRAGIAMPLGVALPVGVPAAFLGAGRGCAGRPGGAVGPKPRPVPRSRSRRGVGRSRRLGSRWPWSGCWKAGTILRGEFRPGGTEREWCDPDVLRQLRRRSLARLRRGGRAGRAGRRWPGSCPPGRASRRWRAGRPALPRARPRSNGSRRWSISWRACRSRPPSWSATCCPPESPATSRACSTSWAPWGKWPGWGAGSLGRDDGRVVLYRPGQRRAARRWPSVAVGRARRQASSTTGCASGCGSAAPRSTASWPPRRSASERRILDALWDLVWAGEVTNDTFAPLRALRWRRPSGERRPRPGRLQLGPPEAAGRWSLVEGRRGRPSRGPGPRRRPRSTGEVRGAATAPPLPTALSMPRHGPARALRRPHPRGRRGRGSPAASGRLPGAAGHGGVRPHPARLLRRGAWRRAVRAARSGGSAAVDAERTAGRPRAARPRPAPRERSGPAPRPTRPSARGCRSGQSVRGRSRLAAPGRRRTAAAPRAAGAYVVSSTAARALPGTWRPLAPDSARVRRPGGGRARVRRAPRPSSTTAGFVNWCHPRGRRAGGGLALAAALEAAGFAAGYRGHVLRPETRRVVAAGRGLSPATAADGYWRRSRSPSRPILPRFRPRCALVAWLAATRTWTTNCRRSPRRRARGPVDQAPNPKNARTRARMTRRRVSAVRPGLRRQCRPHSLAAAAPAWVAPGHVDGMSQRNTSG